MSLSEDDGDRLTRVETTLEHHLKDCEEARVENRSLGRWILSLIISGMLGLGGWAWLLHRETAMELDRLMILVYSAISGDQINP